MGSVHRVLTACAMVLVVAGVQTAIDRCAIVCERPQGDTAGAAAPACHHDSSPLARLGHPPGNCDHPHRMAVVSAVDTASVPRTIVTLSLVAVWAVAPPLVTISGGPVSHPPDRIVDQRALPSPSPLRI